MFDSTSILSHSLFFNELLYVKIWCLCWHYLTRMVRGCWRMLIVDSWKYSWRKVESSLKDFSMILICMSFSFFTNKVFRCVDCSKWPLILVYAGVDELVIHNIFEKKVTSESYHLAQTVLKSVLKVKEILNSIKDKTCWDCVTRIVWHDCVHELCFLLMRFWGVMICTNLSLECINLY